MTEPSSGLGEEKKTIAIRVSPELRGRLDAILQITGQTVNDAGIAALEAWITAKLSDPAVRAKALASLDEEERALQARRDALRSLTGVSDAPADKPKPPARPAGRPSGKAADA